jgi:transcriptional regulator with XRE-family HTH domain
MTETMGDRIRGARTRQRLKQSDLARLVDISTNAMNMIERNKVDPRVSRILKIAQALGVSVDYLLDYEAPRRRNAA